jgi:hypothetical protein
MAHTIPAKPRVGDRVDGVLEWPHDLSPIPLRAMVARVSPTDVAITFHRGTIPFAYFR